MLKLANYELKECSPIFISNNNKSNELLGP